jgi:hypothetical protein
MIPQGRERGMPEGADLQQPKRQLEKTPPQDRRFRGDDDNTDPTETSDGNDEGLGDEAEQEGNDPDLPISE